MLTVANAITYRLHGFIYGGARCAGCRFTMKVPYSGHEERMLACGEFRIAAMNRSVPAHAGSWILERRGSDE